MSTKPAMSAALARARPEEKPKREKLFNAKSTPGRQGKRGITYYVSPATLEDLKKVAERRSVEEDADIRLKDVIQEFLNLGLAKYGMKPTA